MAEIKRIPLQTAPLAGNSKAKKSEKEPKQVPPSVRFELSLSESNEEKYPEFNYVKLLKNADKKRKKERKKEENEGMNGMSLAEEDEDDKIQDMARYFESKYGNRKKSDGVDLGAGYDESDSFIDNTDAYDEIVPQEMTTVFGGFYVNSGLLEFKNTDNIKALHKNLASNKDEDEDDDDDDDDDDDEEESSSDEDSTEEKEEQITKQANKRTISSSENEESQEIKEPPKSKPRIDDKDEVEINILE